MSSCSEGTPKLYWTSTGSLTSKAPVRLPSPRAYASLMQPPPSSPNPAPAARGPRRARASAGESASHRRVLRRQRALALTVLVVVGGGVAVLIASGTTSRTPRSRLGLAITRAHGDHAGVSTARAQAGPFATGLIVLRLVDKTRSVQLPDGKTVPRTLVTYVRYPALGPATGSDLPAAPAARGAGPFPLVVFGHGFAVTPALYARLLRSWARAGYVVAAPVFPLANANAPGGPNESDLPNQPADMRVVISSLLAASKASSGPLSGLIAKRQIAVAGQSDGGDTALAVAYDPRFRDPRVGAAMILSGAEIPGIGAFQIAPGGPPLLATQGTADTINPPSATRAFYDSAPPAKYLLALLGASHLPPYSSQEPQLSVVERVTIAFIDHSLKHIPGSLHRLLSAGRVPGIAALNVNP
jgi:dienelactone hydrolase